MCDVISFAAIFIAGASALNDFSTQQEAGAQAKKLAERNGLLADFAASDARARGEVDAGRLRSQTTRLIGTQRAVIAASGIETHSGSALDVQAGTRAQAELDVQTVRNNAAREAWGYREQGADIRQRGTFEQQAYNNRATGSLLNGGAQIAGYAYQGMSTRPKIGKG